LAAGGTVILTFADCDLASKDSIQGDITIVYIRDESTLELQSTGSIAGSVA
jgi:hypothetical protein